MWSSGDTKGSRTACANFFNVNHYFGKKCEVLQYVTKLFQIRIQGNILTLLVFLRIHSIIDWRMNVESVLFKIKRLLEELGIWYSRSRERQLPFLDYERK